MMIETQHFYSVSVCQAGSKFSGARQQPKTGRGNLWAASEKKKKRYEIVQIPFDQIDRFTATYFAVSYPAGTERVAAGFSLPV